MMARPGRILLVEDNPADVRLLELALRKHPQMSLDVVGDGDAAMAFLEGTSTEASKGRPDLVLLDLNLPRRDGLSVLQAIRDDDELTSLPVVVLSSSRSEEDVARAYRLHASSYVTKPTAFDRWQAIVDDLEGYWFATVKLPGR